MSLVPLGESGAKIPSLGIGTWNSPKDQVGESIKIALKMGYRHIDCAWVYKNEKEVGDALKEIFAQGEINREDVFITSKCWNTHKAPSNVRNACLYTMQCLGVDYLDLYLVHWPVAWKFIEFGGNQWGGEPGEDGLKGTRFDNVPLHQTWAEMEKLVEEGLVKHIGVSNFSIQHLMDLLTYARIKPTCNQVELHPYHAQYDLINFCLYHHITPVAYSPLGSSVEWQKGRPNIRDDPVITRIARERHETPSQTIIRWHIQRGHVVIPKAINPTHIEENFHAVSSRPLTEAQMHEIFELDQKGPGRYLTGDLPWNGFA